MKLLLFLVAFLLQKSYAASAACDADGLHYRCLGENPKCIPLDWLCDGRADCLNGDDEQGQVCQPRGARSKIFERGNCPPLQFECEDFSGGRKCILERWRCDRHVDCKDGMDEQDCDYTAVKPEPPPRLLNIFNLARQPNCSDGQFLCTIIKECLSNRSMTCDGRKDCRDGTDELNCNNGPTSQRPTLLKNTQQSTANRVTSGRTQQIIDRLSSTPILPLLSQKPTSTFFQNLSTLLAQTQSASEKKVEPTAQTSLTKLIVARIGRGSTEAFLPISPNFVEPVSASAHNKPQRVSMQRIVPKTSPTNQFTSPANNQFTSPANNQFTSPANNQVTSSSTSTTTMEPTKSGAKREQFANLFPQFKPMGNYAPIIPQL